MTRGSYGGWQAVLSQRHEHYHSQNTWRVLGHYITLKVTSHLKVNKLQTVYTRIQHRIDVMLKQQARPVSMISIASLLCLWKYIYSIMQIHFVPLIPGVYILSPLYQHACISMCCTDPEGKIWFDLFGFSFSLLANIPRNTINHACIQHMIVDTSIHNCI